jgi:hypothetical protein
MHSRISSGRNRTRVIRRTLLNYCSMALLFASNETNLTPQEIEQMHDDCPGDYQIKSQGIKVTCNCACHARRKKKAA